MDDIDVNGYGDDGGTTVIKIRKKGRQGDGGGSPRRKINKRRKASNSQEERTVITKTKTKTANTDTATSGPSPFGIAMKAARVINTRRPNDEQPAELAELREAMEALDETGRIKLLWRLITEALEGRTPIQSLFPVAYSAKRMGMAHNTAAMRRAIVENDLTLTDLGTVGLAEIKLNQQNKPYVRYIVNIASITAAVPKLRLSGKDKAADILAEHLRRAERNRLLRQAARNTAQGTEGEGDDNSSPSSEEEVVA